MGPRLPGCSAKFGYFFIHTSARFKKTHTALLIRLYHDILLFGMTPDVRGYEWTVDFYRQVLGPGIVQCIFRQSGSDTPAAKWRRHFGMHQHDLTIMQPILQPG
jgi:hypothetical protein